MFVFPETDNMGSNCLLTSFVSLTLGLQVVLVLSLLCFAVDRERPRASEVANLRSAWIRTQHCSSSLVCRGLGSTCECLASQTEERENARVLKVKKTAKTGRKEKRKRSKWRDSRGSESASANLLFLATGLGSVQNGKTRLESTSALASQDSPVAVNSPYSRMASVSFCSFMAAHVRKRWAMNSDQSHCYPKHVLL